MLILTTVIIRILLTILNSSYVHAGSAGGGALRLPRPLDVGITMHIVYELHRLHGRILRESRQHHGIISVSCERVYVDSVLYAHTQCVTRLTVASYVNVCIVCMCYHACIGMHVYVCVCICMYIYIYIYIHTHTYIYIYIYIHIYIYIEREIYHVYIYIYMYSCIHIYTNICMYTHV